MAINFEKSLEVDAPIQEVFAHWRDLGAYARFMPHVRSVRSAGEQQWIWETEDQDWQVALTQELPQEAISWRLSTPHYTSDATVRFATVDEGRTKLVYTAHYPNGLGPNHSAASVTADMALSLEQFAGLFAGTHSAPQQDPEVHAAAQEEEEAEEDEAKDEGEDDKDEQLSQVVNAGQTLQSTLTDATQAWTSSLADAFKSFNALLWSPVQEMASTVKQPIRTWSPRFEVKREGGMLFVSSELPGYTPDDLRIEILNGQLFVSGERASSEEREDATQERFQECLPLNQPVDSRQVDAQLTSAGQLRIALPLKAQTSLAESQAGMPH